MKKLDKNSLDLVKQNIKKLKEIFPDVFTEDKIDFEKLKENLGKFVEESEEKYQFTWFGKKEANKISLTPTKATLRPDKETGKNWDNTKNTYIEGDNLEVLKVIQKAYYKKIKMIYIDPPYNTGKDFIYKDNYKDNLKNYLTLTGQVDEERNPLSTNTETSGRKHSNWLNMIYPRLKLARNLLKDDGVVFISIDDNEVVNLRKIMDEIFGEENFVATIVRRQNLAGKQDAKKIATEQDYILVYVKNFENNFNINKKMASIQHYKYVDEYENIRGKFYLRRLDDEGLTYSEKLNYPIKFKKNEKVLFFNGKKVISKILDEDIIIYPNNDKNNKSFNWRWSKEKVEWGKKQDLIVLRKDKNNNWQVNFKSYAFVDNNLNKIERKNPYGTLLLNFPNNISHKGLKELFNNKKYFDYPKPISLIKELLKIGINSNDLILDFFSGSATTAHAVMELNAEDGGDRRFILVQLPEPTDEKSEAYKAGYKNICEIGKERIRRAGEKIKEDYKDKEWIDNLDIGFKVFKLDSTNIKEWDSNPDNLEQSLLDYGEFIKEGRSEEDLLYEVLLKYGIDLTATIEEKEINNKKVYIVGFGSLIIYFDEIDIEIAKEIIDLVKNYESDFTVLVLKDDSFATSRDKVNIVEFFKQMNLFEKIITL